MPLDASTARSPSPAKAAFAASVRGSPAAPGAGIAIPATVLEGVGIPTAGTALILGVDRILETSRTTVDVTGDLTAYPVLHPWSREEAARPPVSGTLPRCPGPGRGGAMATEGSGASRGGGDDFHNEDVFLVEEGLGLYLVCDGAAGSPAGEVAARVAAAALEEFVERAGGDLDLRTESAARAVVDRAMLHALSAVAAAGRERPEQLGSTTITMLLARGDRGVIGHRGDSRAYLIRRDRAFQLTIDHELTEAAIGRSVPGDFDVFALELRAGDTLVLCTDGAEAVIEDAAIVRAAGDLSPRLLASRIVSTANRRNPEVDATAVVVRVRGEREPGWLELSSEPEGTAFGHRLSLAR